MSIKAVQRSEGIDETQGTPLKSGVSLGVSPAASGSSAPASSLRGSVKVISLKLDKVLTKENLKNSILFLLVAAYFLLTFLGLFPPELLILLAALGAINKADAILAGVQKFLQPIWTLSKTARISQMPRDTDQFTQRVEGIELVNHCYTQTQRRILTTRQAQK